MAEVYWIRKQEHTDIFNQGYVGVTSKTSQDRFKEHVKVANSKASKKSILHKIIKSIGKKGPWNNYFSNKEVWKIADELYLDFSRGITRYSTAKSRGLLETSINTIFKYFKRGWVPLEDPQWVVEFKENAV